MNGFRELFSVSIKWPLRDKSFQALLGIAILIFVLTPVFSTFSMRQVQALSVTLSLSAVSMALLMISTLFGASSIWRDIEKRYTAAVLGLPVTRAAYVYAKFAAIAVVIVSSAFFLGLVSAIAIKISSIGYTFDVPLVWTNIAIAIAFDGLKYMLLAAFGLLFSTLSTSFFLPFFGTIGMFLAGGASQEVYEYISGEMGGKMSPWFVALLKGLYFVLPNFSTFDFKVQAIYGLPNSISGIIFALIYFGIYTSLLLLFAAVVFSRRQLG